MSANLQTKKKETKYTFFMLIKTTPAWLKLKPKDRFDFLGKDIAPILKQHPEVKMRFFDSEAYSGSYSDVIMWETNQVERYQSVVEMLRESAFWDVYFEIKEIIPSIENAYADHYSVSPF